MGYKGPVLDLSIFRIFSCYIKILINQIIVTQCFKEKGANCNLSLIALNLHFILHVLLRVGSHFSCSELIFTGKNGSF